jgi:hypothetical protein
MVEEGRLGLVATAAQHGSSAVRRKMNPDGYCNANFGHGVGSA